MLLIDTLGLTPYFSLLLHLVLWNLHGHGMFKLLWPCFILESFKSWKKVQSSCFANSNSYKNVFPKSECLEKKEKFFLSERKLSIFLKFPFGSSPFNLWEPNLIKFLWALWGSLRLLTTSWISHLFPKWLKILWGCPYVYTVFLTLVVLCLNIFVAVKARNWTVGFSLNSVESGCLKQGLMTLL